jgi:hypothetical protein
MRRPRWRVVKAEEKWMWWIRECIRGENKKGKRGRKKKNKEWK